MLASNLGLTLNTHFCGGHAVESLLSLGMHDVGCGMEDMGNESDSEPQYPFELKSEPCCESTHQVFQIDERVDLQKSTNKVNPVFAVAFIHSFVQPLFISEQKQEHATVYPPPRIEKDIQILFQTFLI